MATATQRKAPRRSIKTFRDYQVVVRKTDERRSRAISLMGLVGEIGDLHSMMKKLLVQKGIGSSFRRELIEEFGDVLWYLTSLATLYKIPLQEIADANVTKAESLYLPGTKPAFDRLFPKDERLPRRFLATFAERPVENGIYVKLSVNGVTVGDALTDNSHEDDGYRFHDVFHLAYTAVLGWSPVTRALLKCKRKSRPKIDEVEDGARAAIIEEAISLLVFHQAEERGWYSEKSAVDIGLLKIIRRLANGLEVRSCTAKQWQSAIWQGYSVFSELVKNKGGLVEVDLDAQALRYMGGTAKLRVA